MESGLPPGLSELEASEPSRASTPAQLAGAQSTSQPLVTEPRETENTLRQERTPLEDTPEAVGLTQTELRVPRRGALGEVESLGMDCTILFPRGGEI